MTILFSMKWNKWICTLCIAFLIHPVIGAPLGIEPFEGVRDLVARRVPWLSAHVRFQAIPQKDGKDQVTLQTIDGILWVKASGPNAAAVGINRYLEDYCHRSMSHVGDNLGPVPILPVIPEPWTINAQTLYRYALNYCTFNYTMSFYRWTDWSWELDWMALHGVNLMLVANGEEAVWQNTLRRLAYSEKEIENFIPGPAFTAWWLMGNLEGWGGPMAQPEIDNRRDLVRHMLTRMRSLGIEPVMPGFYGMVPTSLSGKIKAHIFKQGKWNCGFDRPDILDPCDTSFDRVAGIFYEETRKLYGSDIRFFSGDPFHEGGSMAGVDMGKAGLRIQQVMQQHFPGSIWVLQGWQENPRKELLASLDKSHVLVQELAGENTQNWDTRQGYEGTPFIWCTVTNFGEKPGLGGKLQRFADEIFRASHSPYAAEMQGVGIMPEGLNNNPVTYDLALELGWHPEKVDVNQWIRKYVLARYGKEDDQVLAAWSLLLQTTYGGPPGPGGGNAENLLCARPSLDVHGVTTWGSCHKGYDQAKFATAVALFVKAAPHFSSSATYQLDLIDFKREELADQADSVYAHVVRAYHAKDLLAFDQASRQFLQLSDQENRLLNSNPYYQLATYRRKALDAGNNPEEKRNNLCNALTIVTYWGGNDSTQQDVRDYAYKEWSGMMESFYKARWEKYFAYLRSTLTGVNAAPPDYFMEDRNWVKTQLAVQQ